MLTVAQFYGEKHLARRFGVADSLSSHHSGQDVNGWARGTRIPSFVSGKVVARGWSPGNFGYWVTVEIRSGLYAHFCHLDSLDGVPTNGTWIGIGADVGPLGTTGYSTGPHLHAMVSTATNPDFYRGLKDPLPYIRAAVSGGGGAGGGGFIDKEIDMSSAVIKVVKNGRTTGMRLAAGQLAIQETTNNTIIGRWKLEAGQERDAFTGEVAKTIHDGWVWGIAQALAAIGGVVAGKLDTLELQPVSDAQVQVLADKIGAGIEFPDFPDADEIAEAVVDEQHDRLAE